jgi:tRNA uridine 5-carbamoylmethylation protein Kti12
MPAPADDPVLILTGPPGAGKTATARVLAASRKRAVHIESDAFFHFIASGYVEPWKPESHAQNTLVMDAVAEAALRYARGGYFTIVDGIVSPRWFFEPLRDSLRAAGRLVAYAVLRPPLAVCLSRAVGRDEHPLADPQVVERLWHEFEDLGSLEPRVVETDGMGIREVADHLEERLAAGRLGV